MSSELQLDVRHLNRWRRHLVNAYEVKAGMMFIAGKTVWSMPECFKVVCIPCTALYQCSALPFYLCFIVSLLNWLLTRTLPKRHRFPLVIKSTEQDEQHEFKHLADRVPAPENIARALSNSSYTRSSPTHACIHRRKLL